MTATAKVIEDSVSQDHKRITTLQLRYQRFIHAEFMTHRMFSRNASSSRAIPVAKMIDQVRNDPAMPVHWGANQPGMQASQQLEGDALAATQRMWQEAAMEAAGIAEIMSRYGAHKQVANRILEPFQFISVIVTATEWDNFFELRDHADAQPEIRVLAQAMKAAMAASVPSERSSLHDDDCFGWHLPYITDDERHLYHLLPEFLAKISAARCARVSYLTHDGEEPNITNDLALYERLVGSKPLHASPVEHQACAMQWATSSSRNFRGWKQFRETVEVGFAS